MLLVHVCCTDCALKLLKSLQADYGLSPSGIALYFLNPNIHPESEYLARLKALQLVLKDKPYKLIVPNYRPKDYFASVKPLSKYHLILDKRKRCPQCWHLRLSQSFEYAKTNGFDSVTSTLLSSIYQDSETIIALASTIASKLGLKLLIPKDVDHCLHTAGFYKQNYCGCVYSLKDRLEEKHLQGLSLKGFSFGR